jgi:peptidoglycan/LPS O-acetylase OafA/YrhL
MKRNLNIEMIRAIAILYVLLYHFMVSIPTINTGEGMSSLYIESFG